MYSIDRESSNEAVEARIPLAALKGRGAASRLAHRFAPDARQAFDDGWPPDAEDATAAPPQTQVTWEEARSIIASNDSPDIYFDKSINPYRGCEHVMRRENLLLQSSWHGPAASLGISSNRLFLKEGGWNSRLAAVEPRNAAFEAEDLPQSTGGQQLVC